MKTETKAATANILRIALCWIAFSAVSAAGSPLSSQKPVQLECDSLVNPLGLDDTSPLFSWQLQDSRFGARQSAYQVQVGTTAELLAAGKADIWDSGRVDSDQSVGVRYQGARLVAEKRYYWRVQLWDQENKPYPASEVAWWETGLLSAENWHARWIGYEEKEHRRLRESDAVWITNVPNANDRRSGDLNIDFRLAFELSQRVAHAALYVTGKDTAAAWVNGKQVLARQPLPPWKQTAWQTYARQDVTSELHAGKNLLAVDVTSYSRNSGATPSGSDAQPTPMNACLIVEMTDGSVTTLTSGTGWKAVLGATGDWNSAQYDDSAWQNAIVYTPPVDRFETTTLGKPLPTGPVVMLRHGFTVDKPILSARLYATALGAYQFHLNGRVVGDQILSPGWTDYRIQVTYQAYDVTRDLHVGKNAIAAYLGPGWYATPLMWAGKGYNYGDTPPALKAQLRVEHTDGSVEWVLTDESWRADISPILKSEIYDGESYDARRVQQGWDTALLSEATWNPVLMVKPSEPTVVPQYFQPIREEKVLTARSISTPKPGVYVYDFGQDLAGVARLRVRGPAGTDVRLRFAEIVNPDGTLYVDNLRTAKATDHYVLAGNGIEQYQPYFTFHGFRYVELTGLGSKPDLTAVKAVVFHTDAPFATQLHTGNEMINQLWSNIVWGQRSNFIGVPTDCPQRDERLGWTGDAQVFWRTASYNMGLAAFSRKFTADLRGTQTGTDMFGIFAPGTVSSSAASAAGWSDAGVIIPWTAWLQYGDTRIVEQNWSAMQRYLSAIEAANGDYLWKNLSGIPYGDWLAPGERTKEELLATALWAYDVSRMQQMAHALQRETEEQEYRELYTKIKAAFIKAYVHEDGFVGAVDRNANAVLPPGSKQEADQGPMDTQTAYVLALYMRLLPEELRPAAARKLVAKIEARNWTLGTGFLGTPYLLETLTDTGHADIAYRLLLNTEFPSWGYMVQHGATTMWERWNGDQMLNDPGMNSFNHYAYGAVGEWLYRYVAGIDADPSDPGFHHIILHPNFDSRLGSMAATYDSAYGPITSEWKVSENVVNWTVVVPPNTKALVVIPIGDKNTILEGGRDIQQNQWLSFVREKDGFAVYEAQPGSYAFALQN